MAPPHPDPPAAVEALATVEPLPTPPVTPPRPAVRHAARPDPGLACRRAQFRFQQGATLAAAEWRYLREGCLSGAPR